MSVSEVRKLIDAADFNLYGNYKKVEKKKLIDLFKNSKGKVELLGITTDKDTGNRVLNIRFWESQLGYEDEDICWDLHYQY